MTLGFPASAASRLAAAAIFCAGAAWMVRTALDGPQPRSAPPPSPATATTPFTLHLESTAPVSAWSVTADGAEIPPDHSDARSWSGAVACAEDAEVLVRAEIASPGPRALRVRAAGERILWGEGSIVERFEARKLRGSP